MTTRILIADDHPIVRSGIRNELGRHIDFLVVGEALNGDDTVQLTYTLKPDILLLDIHMPGKRSIDVVQEIKNQVPGCHILVLSAHGDTPTIIGMLKAGVHGYILKDEDPEIIAEAIQAVLDGDTWLSPGVSDRLATILGPLNGRENCSEFTRRELEVLKSVATGSTTREIANNLQMAERTVEFHITNILRKLGAKGRLEAVMKAKERGIL
jgi:two-component system, NarL family, response regulator DegU